MKNPIKILSDGFKNVLKGLGGSRDPRGYNEFQMGTRITQSVANNLYVYNWLAGKIVDIPIDDATRKWRTLLISDADEKEEIENLMKEFDVKGTVNLASKWARVFGGAVIIAIIDGQDQEEPLIVEQIRPGTLKNFIVLDRYNIYPSQIERDILSSNFGNPEFYTVSRSGQPIHHTRLYKVQGDMTTLLELEQQNYWGNSIFTALWDPISDSQVVSQSISDLVFEANVDVYRVNGLNALIAEGDDDLVIKRLKLAHEMKGVINGIALDKEDEYDKKNNSFEKLPEIDDRFIQKVSGASNIPVTRLLGISPAGQNATGESDMLNYYDFIQSLQENDLRPIIDWMDSIVMASSKQQNKEFEYEFKPLKQMTESEQATVDYQLAQRDQIYLDQDIIDPSDVVANLAERGTYVSIDENRVEEEKELAELRAEIEALKPEPVSPISGQEPEPDEEDDEED
jgi:phage-related protein (TIGR01555 family)